MLNDEVNPPWTARFRMARDTINTKFTEVFGSSTPSLSEVCSGSGGRQLCGPVANAGRTRFQHTADAPTPADLAREIARRAS